MTFQAGIRVSGELLATSAKCHLLVNVLNRLNNIFVQVDKTLHKSRQGGSPIFVNQQGGTAPNVLAYA